MTGGSDRARRILAECLGIPQEEVPENARLGDPATWDSLAHVRIVLAVEEARGRSLSSEEILGLVSLSDLEKLL